MTEYVTQFSKAEPYRRGSHLVVLLHGYGSNEKDLMGLVPYLPGEKITYVALRAPQPVGYPLQADADSAYVGQTAMGYQWWPLNQQLETVGFRAIELATDYLLTWLEPLATDFESVSLLGFSQGMAVASSAARRRPDLIKTVVGLSGYAVEGGENYFQDATLTGECKLPFFWGRGDADPIITADKLPLLNAG
ncbi:MAG: phospholipase [Rothia sp. (in: high G+C Gram-positive bacteria)]|nr:phospholipase [Rothia sp. (in: high G+C Gram-positive bacteria)]